MTLLISGYLLERYAMTNLAFSLSLEHLRWQ